MSAEPNHDDMIAQFTDVTGVDAERARFFLEMTGWQPQLAMASFYESSDMEVEPEDIPVPGAGAGAGLDADVANTGMISDPSPEAATRAQLSQGLNSLLAAMTSGATAGIALPGVPPQKPKEAKPAKPQHSRDGPVTLDSLRNRQNSDLDSSDDDDQKQAFYAGGSQSSGQQVLGPPKKRDELVAEMFKKAREHGAQEVSVQPGSGGPSFFTKKQSGHFSGTGYKLGEKENDTEVVGEAGNADGEESDVREVVLRLWSTGFTVDGGQLRSYQDPANMEFLNYVKRGEVPRELIRDYKGQEVQLTMEDRRTEDYVPPRQATRAFSGQGQMLGSPAPATIGSTVAVSENDRQANEVAARTSLPLTEGEAVTNIQFRLMDGTRLVAQFNPSHTVHDLHSYINTARPQYASSNYVLALFPNKELSEKEQTIQQANLFNSALIQKVKR